MNIFNLVGIPLGWLLRQCYNLVNNYGVSLILFTIIIQIILLPTAIKQKKSQSQTTALMPDITRLQKMYKNNREKLAAEQQKLNEEAGISQYASCLPMLFQMPILFGLIEVVYRPINFILQISAESVSTLANFANTLPGIIVDTSRHAELSLVSAIAKYPTQFRAFDSDLFDKISGFKASFLGIDMTAMPKFGFTLLAVLPILAGVAAFLQMKYMEKINKKASDSIGAAATPGGGMMALMMPAMSTFIGFTLPMGINLYWVIRSLVALAQEFILDKIMPQERLVKAERDRIELIRKETKQKNRGRSSKTFQVEQDVEGKTKEVTMNQKQYNAHKLELARKEWEEKYILETPSEEEDAADDQNKGNKGKSKKKK